MHKHGINYPTGAPRSVPQRKNYLAEHLAWKEQITGDEKFKMMYFLDSLTYSSLIKGIDQGLVTQVKVPSVSSYMNSKPIEAEQLKKELTLAGISERNLSQPRFPPRNIFGPARSCSCLPIETLALVLIRARNDNKYPNELSKGLERVAQVMNIELRNEGIRTYNGGNKLCISVRV